MVVQSSNYFWPEFPGEPVSPQVFAQCQRLILTPAEFAASQQTLIEAKASIKPCKKSHDWGSWTERSLIEKGFKVLGEPTILAVAESEDRFAIQFVYLPGQQCDAMENLAAKLFDDHAKPTKIETRGQSLVTKRGDSNGALSIE